MRRPKQLATSSGPHGVFITATDTGVGKTLVTSALLMCLTKWGIDVGVMKPIETGVLPSRKAQSDGARLRSAAGNCDSMAEVSPYVFRLPVAPLSAARAEGKTIQMATVLRAFRTLDQKHELVIVEGAGGVYVPIIQSLNIIDLIYKVKLPVVVVGRSSLGGINHALLTIHALRQRKIPIVALVLNQPRPLRTKIVRVQERSTIDLLKQLAGVPIVGPLPYSPALSRNWNEGVAQIARTTPIKKLARLVLA